MAAEILLAQSWQSINHFLSASEVTLETEMTSQACPKLELPLVQSLLSAFWETFCGNLPNVSR